MARAQSGLNILVSEKLGEPGTAVCTNSGSANLLSVLLLV